MAINFCHESLGTKILCSQVSTSSHEIENIISGDPMTKNRGFLAESFVRPPVDIIVQFPCPVNISWIVINGCVGTQRSTGCELFVQSEAPQSAYDAFNSGVFINVGKYSWDCDKKGVCVVSGHIRNASSCCGPAADGENFTRQELNGRLSRCVSVVWSLRIRIIRTLGSSVPAVAALDTWGYVAYSCPAPLARAVLYKWHNLNYPPGSRASSSSSFAANDDDAVTSRHKRDVGLEARPTVTQTEEDSFEIPEEFLDGLTFEIMALPVRLPSGNVIDERTLDRFTREEAKWGRGQCDPFTGKPLDATHKPIYDVALKARIDAFLLIESPHRPMLQNVPRTTGPIQRSSDELLTSRSLPTSQSKPPPVVANRPSSSDTQQRSQAPPDPSRRFLSHLATGLQQLSGSSRSGTSRAVPVKASATPSAAVCSCGSSAGPLYSLPCSHRLCRPCLLASKEQNVLKCNRCQEPFGPHDPVLCHTAR